MKKNTTHKILLVDDHPIVGASTKSVLEVEDNIEVIGVVYSAKELFAFLEKRLPDILILDVSLPDIDGFEIFKRLKKTNHNMDVIIYTMHNIPRFIEYFYDSGAKGFVLKSGEFGELIHAISTVVNGQRYFPTKEIQETGLDEASEENQIQLTELEKKLIIHLDKNYSTLEIERRLSITKAEIFSLRKSLLFKTNVSNTQKLIEKAKMNKWI